MYDPASMVELVLDACHSWLNTIWGFSYLVCIVCIKNYSPLHSDILVLARAHDKWNRVDVPTCVVWNGKCSLLLVSNAVCEVHCHLLPIPFHGDIGVLIPHVMS